MVSGTRVNVERHLGDVQAVAVLEDHRLVSGHWDGQVRLWHTDAPGSGFMELGRHDRNVRAVVGLGDGRVITAGDDHRVRIWDPTTPGDPPIELGNHEGGVGALLVLADGRVVSGGDDGRLRLWDPGSPLVDPAEVGAHDDGVASLVALEDGRFVSGGSGRSAYPSRIHSKLMPSREVAEPSPRMGDDAEAGWEFPTVWYGRLPVPRRPEYGLLLLWDPAMPGAGPVKLGRDFYGVSTLVAPGDMLVLSRGTHGDVLVWDAADPDSDPIQLHVDSRHRAIGALADGRLVIGGLDRSVQVWDPAKPVAAGVELACSAAAITSMGSVLSIADVDHGVSVWSLDTQNQRPAGLSADWLTESYAKMTWNLASSNEGPNSESRLRPRRPPPARRG